MPLIFHFVHFCLSPKPERCLEVSWISVVTVVTFSWHLSHQLRSTQLRLQENNSHVYPETVWVSCKPTSRYSPLPLTMRTLWYCNIAKTFSTYHWREAGLSYLAWNIKTTLPIINLLNCTDVFPLRTCYSVTVSTDNYAYWQTLGIIN